MISETKITINPNCIICGKPLTSDDFKQDKVTEYNMNIEDETIFVHASCYPAESD